MTEVYQLRGSRVDIRNEKTIRHTALNACRYFKFNAENSRNCEQIFEGFFEYGITIAPVDDEDWLGVTKGHYDPSSLTIRVPESIYEGACDGERDDLFVMLHELGHLFLAHRSLMYCSNNPPTKYEDSEWQADLFAVSVLQNMGFDVKDLLEPLM